MAQLAMNSSTRSTVHVVLVTMVLSVKTVRYVLLLLFGSPSSGTEGI